MKNSTNPTKEDFRINWSDWDKFSDFLHSVLHKETEAEVECTHTDETIVSVTLPKAKGNLFSKIRSCGLIL